MSGTFLIETPTGSKRESDDTAHHWGMECVLKPVQVAGITRLQYCFSRSVV